ncbi:discoidin domain-containing protein [Evansella sp. AB-rgal1]|uniref:discoidin domain-containing protein n=1 Tax=Evansella sp. AB-rgal1 TaxID=3242696 RepID=UPI00359DFC0F
MKINLAGNWRFRLDPNDQGRTEGWQQTRLTNEGFTLPGTACENRIGTPLDMSLTEKMTKESVASFREKYSYRGKVWLQKEVDLPSELLGAGHIFFQRILGESAIWINGDFIGKEVGFSTGHRYAIDFDQYSGQTITVTISLDNRNHYHLGELASGYTNQTQTYWLGIIGELYVSDELTEDLITTVYDPKEQRVEIKLAERLQKQEPEVMITDQEGKVVPQKMRWDEEIGRYVCRTKGWQTWSEFTPVTYYVKASTKTQTLQKPFGLVDLTWDENHFFLFGKRLFLRGTLDCAVFPQTGYPAMDEREWERIFTTCIEHGLNHIRFHSWCPPEAAFAVADRLGVYLMPEGPFWMDEWFHNSVGDFPEHYELIPSELKKIVTSYGHHPSFCFFAVGNELHGDFKFLAQLIRELPFKEQQIMTTVTANTTNLLRDFYEGADDFFVGVEYEKHGLRGNRFLDQMMVSTDFNMEDSLSYIPVPTISHENGQYASYPDLSEPQRMTGNLVAVNELAVANDLAQKGLLDQAEDFLKHSQKFAFEQYKAEIEMLIRSDSLAGYQLLGLQDYPGQASAMVGFLDSSWKEKGIVSKEAIAAVCGPLVPMAEVDRRILRIGETLEIHCGVRSDHLVPISGKGHLSINHGEICLFEQSIDLAEINSGYQRFGTIHWQVPTDITNFLQLEIRFEVRLEDKIVTNQWRIWIDGLAKVEVTDQLLVADQLSSDFLSEVNEGKSGYLYLDPRHFNQVEPGNFFSVFWSPVFFKSNDSIGTVVRNHHPLFNLYESGQEASLQFKELLEAGVHFTQPKQGSLISSVPNFFSNEIRCYLAEYRLGAGRLLISGIPLLEDSISQTAFKKAVEQYLLQETGTTTAVAEISEEELIALLHPKETQEGERKTDYAFRQATDCDNAKSNRFGSGKAVDGNPLTYWTCAAQTTAHWWSVDLGTDKAKLQLEAELVNWETVGFKLLVSSDGEKWQSYGKTSDHQELQSFMIHQPVRFVKLAFIHPLNTSPQLRRVSLYQLED